LILIKVSIGALLFKGSLASRVNSAVCFSDEHEAAMRWVYLTVVILFVAATLIFVFQNVELVTMSFLGLGIRAPLAVVAAVAYILGALSGGSLYALLRKSVQGSRPSRP
jgi:uncharacterized integral membrane protein